MSLRERNEQEKNATRNEKRTDVRYRVNEGRSIRTLQVKMRIKMKKEVD